MVGDCVCCVPTSAVYKDSNPFKGCYSSEEEIASFKVCIGLISIPYIYYVREKQHLWERVDCKYFCGDKDHGGMKTLGFLFVTEEGQ